MNVCSEKKDEAFDSFKNCKILVEIKLAGKLRDFRTDNGLQFYSDAFNRFCNTHGITKHRTRAGTPQQNGLPERFNRTILERVRCMLLIAGQRKIFWAETLMTNVYLIN